MNKESPDSIILENAKDFLNSGLSIFFKSAIKSRDIKLAIVSIQTSIELFAKFRIIKSHDIAAIITEKKPLPEGLLVDAAKAGKFHTIPYWKCLEKIRENGELSETDNELIGRLQNLRNALVHFAASIDIDEVRMDIAWLLIRVLSMFAAGDDRDNGEMRNHRSFLDPDNFSSLVNFGPYRDEAVDAAGDNLDTEDVFRCWECENDSMSLRVSETYYCYCCGLSAIGHVADYADCPRCHARRGVFYDALNANNDQHRGRCLHCHADVWVWRCPDCAASSTDEKLTGRIICKSCSD